jgi:two-component system CheB/CheR fusion protein
MVTNKATNKKKAQMSKGKQIPKMKPKPQEQKPEGEQAPEASQKFIEDRIIFEEQEPVEMLEEKPEEGEEKQEEGHKPEKNFPIVGIGASAGGLSAFEAFFSGIPVDIGPGAAFVIVQHLDPKHKSILNTLIGRYTNMPVYEIIDGMDIQPNCAYVIPPNKDLIYRDGALHTLEPTMTHGHRMPIDFFFRSLAEGKKEMAVGIILSGTGSDGTLGIRSIKAEGGMVMAQSPDTSEYDSMPRSVIDTGLADYILPPKEMPAQLIAYVNQAFGETAHPTARAEDSMNRIFNLVFAQTGHDFSHYKMGTIGRRIERRMVVHSVKRIDEYVHYLEKNPAEVEALFRDFLISVTSFFRNPKAFDKLQEEVIPKILIGKLPNDLIRIWVPGCSTGEEAYSIGILLQEYKESVRRNLKIQIFATDIDRRAIERARAGIYPASIATDVTMVTTALIKISVKW